MIYEIYIINSVRLISGWNGPAPEKSYLMAHFRGATSIHWGYEWYKGSPEFDTEGNHLLGAGNKVMMDSSFNLSTYAERKMGVYLIKFNPNGPRPGGEVEFRCDPRPLGEFSGFYPGGIGKLLKR